MGWLRSGVKWPLWAQLFCSEFTVFQSLGGQASARRVSHEPCFRQAHCFVRGLLRFPPVPPNPTCTHSHIWGFLKFGLSKFYCRGASHQKAFWTIFPLCPPAQPPPPPPEKRKFYFLVSSRFLWKQDRWTWTHWVPPDLCLPRCVVRDCPCIW